jgi:hypothetical protein
MAIDMTNSEQLAEKIKNHLTNGGAVRFATCYRATILKAKHIACVEGSKLAADNGVYVRSGKSRVFWMESYIAFSK